ncbi:MAG TPA: Fic family protein [Candidatus Polarisedimenticolaceae bacterium]|nr:Fic family protein [Candidatus Polarisedimenticolaceae bacterium]
MDVKLPVNPEILKGISQVDHFRGLWAGGTLVPAERLEQLRRSARAQSIVSSCRIAGVRAGDDEIVAIVNAAPLASLEAAELTGYGLAIDRPFPADGPIVTVEEVAALNAVLLGKPGDPPSPSPLREKPLHQEVFDAEGRAMGRVLQTLPPRLLQEKLDGAVSWLEIELRSGEQHPLLVIGAFFVYFTAISPFDRGNGRAARVMVPHLLRRAGFGFIDYASLEGLFEEMRFDYYDAIDQAETKIWTEEADLAPWLGFFIGALNTLTSRLQAKLDIEVRSRELPPLQRAILATIREHGTGAASLLIASTGANRNTLKDNLRRLVDRGLLERIGTKRGTFYRLPALEAVAGRVPAED